MVQFHRTCAVHECQTLVEFADFYSLVVLLIKICVLHSVRQGELLVVIEIFIILLFGLDVGRFSLLDANFTG